MLSLIGSIQPLPVLAQQSLDCSVNGFCVAPNLTNLLGLPNGTLNIHTYQPWDEVVKGPARATWLPLEAEARAALAALHGVPNDFRLPHAALNDLRAYMFLRLVSLARQKAAGTTPLTGVEQDALDTFGGLIVQRRVRASQKALDEYARWQTNPCHYTVPPGFGFDQYEPGPLCAVGGVMLSGPPRPPTKEQFTAYGAALAMTEDEALIKEAKRIALGMSSDDPTFTYNTSADAAAALRTADEALLIAAGIAGAALASGVATIAAVSSAAVASFFAAAAGSFSIFGTTASATAIGSFASAGVIGVGVAASLPALVILSVVVAVVYIIQFDEDQSVLPMLKEALETARQPPDIWAVANSGNAYNRLELFATFIYQTLPSYDEQRVANTAPAVPSQRLSGDPRFEVNGAAVDVIETWAPDSRLQQTFMSQGWFVTRTRTQASPEIWGPWRWSLTIRYRGANLSDSGIHTAGIQPAGFFHTYQSPNLQASHGTKVTELNVLGRSFLGETVRWKGNRAPVLAPTASAQPLIGSPVTFNAGVIDPDGDHITAIRWFIEDPTISTVLFKPSFAECSLTPPGQIDGASGLPYRCPWAMIDDLGTGISYTFAHPGTWSVRVEAQDGEGAVGSASFFVTVGNLAPTLTITQLPFVVLPPDMPATEEGQPVTVSGTVNYPGLPDGNWGALTTLVVDWGDGQVTTRMYPCSSDRADNGPSDARCGWTATTSPVFFPMPGQTVTPGPWSFTFSHTYAYGSGAAFVNPAQIKVHAYTTLNGRSQTERINFNITNVPPAVEVRATCPVVPSVGPFGEVMLCLAGDYREVALGQPLTINGRISDVPGAGHFVKVVWGDGTSSAHPPGCTVAGCPGTVAPWPGAPPAPTSYTPKYFSVTRTYDAIGTYPITLVVDDSGSNGQLSYSTQAVIFGISPLAGPAEVNAGASATYAFTSTSPARATPVLTPTCEGGSVTSETNVSFTCEFNDVAQKTVRKAKLQALIAGTTFERSLDVDVSPRPTTISEITGPATVIAGTTATYTYSATYSPLGLVLFGPSCGAHGSVVSSVGGSSITCRFHDVDEPSTTQVGIAIAAGGASTSSHLSVTVDPDLTPPVLTLPALVQVSSTSNAGATASFSVSAVDAVSGPSELIICNASSGQLFPIGTTTVTCSAADWVGNVATGSFPVVVIDVTPPSLTLPAPQELNATGPTGAVTTFAASAADAIPVAPQVSCAPPSGSMFAVGTTDVMCSATDAAGNTASGTFTVTVLGAAEQIGVLYRWVERLSIDATLKRRLLTSLKQAADEGPNACSRLANVESTVLSAGNKLTKGQANHILSEVARIKAVLGC